MSRHRSVKESEKPSGPGVRALKWVGAITAVVSLLLGVQQLTSRIRDSLQRNRETTTLIEVARGQASRLEFPDAWKNLDRALALNPGDAVDAARVEIGFAWLEDSHPGPGQPFSTITDAVTPVLDRALLKAQGKQRADILAHLGWATFLRTRNGASGDPDARYQEALAADPGNAFANAMLGHWLMWNGGKVDASRARFDKALAAGGAAHAFVRRLQLAALINRQGDEGDAELLRVASEMRQRAEPIDTDVADKVYWIYTLHWGPRAGAPLTPPPSVSAADLETTFEWILAKSASGQRTPEVSAYVRAMLQEAAGDRAAALATLRGLRIQDVPPLYREPVQKALARLAKAPQ